MRNLLTGKETLYRTRPFLQSGRRGPLLSPTPLGTARASCPCRRLEPFKPMVDVPQAVFSPRNVWLQERISQSAFSAFRALEASFRAAR